MSVTLWQNKIAIEHRHFSIGKSPFFIERNGPFKALLVPTWRGFGGHQCHVRIRANGISEAQQPCGRCNAHASLQWLTPKMPVKVGHLENMRGKKTLNHPFCSTFGHPFRGLPKTGNLMCGETMIIFRPGNQQLLHGFIGGARKAQTQRQAGTCWRLWAWSSVDKNSIVQKIQVSVVHIWWYTHDFYHYCWFIRPIFVGI